jgi:hypothetical protein
MSWYCPCLVPVILLGLSFSGAVRAESHSDPSGFTCTGPEGWEVISASRMGEVSGAMDPAVQKWVQDNGIDLSQVKVIFLRNGDLQSFLENINVVVESGQILVSEAMRKHLLDVVPRKFAQAGLTVIDFQNRIVTINGRAMVASDYRVKFPDSTGVGTIRQRQYVVPGGGKTYTITCTALPDTFDTYEPRFAAFAESFVVPAPTATGIDWSAVLKSSAVWGGLAGLIGGIAGAKLLKKPNKQPAPPNPDPDVV